MDKRLQTTPVQTFDHVEQTSEMDFQNGTAALQEKRVVDITARIDYVVEPRRLQSPLDVITPSQVRLNGLIDDGRRRFPETERCHRRLAASEKSREVRANESAPANDQDVGIFKVCWVETVQ